ncbi:MAG TPA: beta-1,6-N-acetylglucosaminyltransferase [Bacteroidia bacterium]|nr:beta-1,6-N-acetylglucosaminyltransferase [Bacteroidia bacterium]
MKIAYLIISPKNPLQVYNLIHALSNGKNHFFIHLKKGMEFEIEKINKLPNVCFSEKKHRSGWAGFKVLLATIDLIKLAKKADPDFDYYINLSDSCYPIYNNEIIEKYLFTHNFNFIEGLKLPSNKLDAGGLQKIELPWFQDEFQDLNPYVKKYLHKAIHLIYRILNIKRSFPKEYDAYFGSQWWALTNFAVDILLNSVNNEKKLLNFFKRSFAADEQYIQTVIYNAKELEDKIINKPFRYVDWNTNGPPKTLTMTDYNDILQSGFLFARKFDHENEPEIIRALNVTFQNKLN